MASRSIDPRIRQRRASVRRSQGRKRLRWVVAAVVVAVVVVGGLALLHTPLFAARVVTVTGGHPHTSDSAILAAAGLEGHPAMIDVSPGATAARVERLPFVASASVRRLWPDGVRISVTERSPALQMPGPGASWSVLDANGRTLEVVPHQVPDLRTYVVETPKALLVPPAVGRSLPVGASSGMRVATTLPLAFSGQVDAITEAPDTTVSLKLNSGITVLLGTDTDLTAKYNDVAAIIAHGSLHPTSTIDVTVPSHRRWVADGDRRASTVLDQVLR